MTLYWPARMSPTNHALHAPCAHSECPSQTHATIQRLIDSSCTRGVPSPPPGLSPPPPPRSPPPPRTPPPLASHWGKLRQAATESLDDEDCHPVTYEQCRQAAIEVGTAFGLSTDLEISLAACESGVDTTPCFIGCSLGSQVNHSSRIALTLTLTLTRTHAPTLLADGRAISLCLPH